MKKTQSNHSIAAKELKKELTTAFPGVKFSVKSDYSSLNIYWAFGPSIEEVEKYSQRRQIGHYDGMNDMYVFTGNALNVDAEGNVKSVAGVKFVFENRNVAHASDYKLRTDVLNIYSQIAEMWGWVSQFDGKDFGPAVWAGVDQSSSNKFYRIMRDCSFKSDNIELLKVEYSNNVEGEPYQIFYKDLNTGKNYAAKRMTTRQTNY